MKIVMCPVCRFKGDASAWHYRAVPLDDSKIIEGCPYCHSEAAPKAVKSSDT